MVWQHLFFSFNGRISRASFWIGTIPLVIGWLAAMTLFNWMFMRVESLVPVYGFGIVAGLMLLWGQLGVCIKRLHDRGKSGWWLLLFWALPVAIGQAGESTANHSLRIAAAIAIGLIWLWAVVELGVLRGTKGPNDYGADPLPSA